MQKIIHVDMDCFYAAIEIRDRPALASQPVAVGGSSGRGVIATCNYVARQFGVRSAMPYAVAKRLCPSLIMVNHRFEKYRAASAIMHEIFHRYTDRVEALSLDEAYLDVTDSQHCAGSASWLAKRIRGEIQENIGVTASAGISCNKFIAKVASDWRKPNGQFCVPPEQVLSFVADLPVQKIHGVGRVTAKKMFDLGIYRCRDLQKLDRLQLNKLFGKFGLQLYDLSRGIDHRVVTPRHGRKSLSVENTFEYDLVGAEACTNASENIYEALLKRLDAYWREYRIKAIVVKIKFADFSQKTMERRAEIVHQPSFMSLLKTLVNNEAKPVRLIGLGVKMAPKASGSVQLCLPFYATE